MPSFSTWCGTHGSADYNLFMALVQPFRWFLPADAALHGPALDRHLLLNLWLAAGLLALSHLLVLLGLAVRRRAHRPIHRLTLEYLPLAALTLLFAALAFRAHTLWAAQRYTGADMSALQVEVTGMQFAWYFRYPGKDARFGQTRLDLVAPGEGNPLGLDAQDPAAADDLVRSQLVLPADREVDLTLRAQDVIHGFNIPELRLKQNAVPGQTVHIHFTPTTPGDYAILCTQLCGAGHYRMQSTLRVLAPADFNTWLARQQALQAESRP
jgi:cytochrome c oxidase subunit II